MVDELSGHEHENVFPPLDGLNFFCNVPKSFDWSFLERCSTLRAGGVTSFFFYYAYHILLAPRYSLFRHGKATEPHDGGLKALLPIFLLPIKEYATNRAAVSCWLGLRHSLSFEAGGLNSQHVQVQIPPKKERFAHRCPCLANTHPESCRFFGGSFINGPFVCQLSRPFPFSCPFYFFFFFLSCCWPGPCAWVCALAKGF